MSKAAVKKLKAVKQEREEPDEVARRQGGCLRPACRGNTSVGGGWEKGQWKAVFMEVA